MINLQLARSRATKRKALHWVFIGLSILIAVIAVVLILQGSPYLAWDLTDPETAVAGTFYHIFEWIFIRIAPLALVGTIVGAIVTCEKKNK